MSRDFQHEYRTLRLDPLQALQGHAGTYKGPCAIGDARCGKADEQLPQG